jgi:hypothetical protein
VGTDCIILQIALLNISKYLLNKSQRDGEVHKGGSVARLALLSSKQGLRLGRGKQQRRGRGLVSLRLGQQRYKAVTFYVLEYILMHLFHTHPAANQGGVHGLAGGQSQVELLMAVSYIWLS